MNNAAERIIGTIGAIQTLIENFPMSILAFLRGKKYTSVIEFILDVLKQLGIDDITITNKVLELFFNVPNAVEIYNELSKLIYEEIQNPTDSQIEVAIPKDIVPDIVLVDDPDYIVVNDVYYVKKTSSVADDLESPFLEKLEDAVKVIIMDILTAVLSCSIIPEIPDEYMDDADSPLSIPIGLFDWYQLFDYCPSDEIGRNFYNVENELNVNSLYKSYDFNAFIWYAMNRGIQNPQREINKMMWDSRLSSYKKGINERPTYKEWNDWLNSKKESGEPFTISGKTVEFTDPLHPIIQISRDEGYQFEDRLKVSFAAQTYKTDKLFNRSLYQFNKDYLTNIKIFVPKVILANMVECLLNFGISGMLGINYSINTKIFDAKIDQILKKVLEEDDLQVSDCYYSFSNDDFDSLIQEMEMQRYGATYLGSETSPAIKTDNQHFLDAINSISSQATAEEKMTAITKTVYDIAAIPAQDGAIEISDSLGLDYNSKWFMDVVLSLLKPILKAILSPQVILIFIIDFSVMGLINLDSIDFHDFNNIFDAITKKIISMFVSIIRYVKDKIAEFLLDLFYEYVKPLLVKFCEVILKEKLDEWIELLNEALECIPTFDFSRNKVKAMIDDVNYADIEQTTTPETSSGC